MATTVKDETSNERPKTVLSFGFTKKVETRKIQNITLSETTDEKESVTLFETGQSKKRKEEDLVIPMIKENKWRRHDSKIVGTRVRSSEAKGDELDAEAVQEIIKDAEESAASEQAGEAITVPLLMRNRVPEGFETDDQLDVALRPDGPEEANYEEIPIEKYGMAMLRGMGWKEGEGIGKNKKLVAPLDAILRPKGLGLGARHGNNQPDNGSKKPSSDKRDEEELEVKKGSYCLITSGPQRDLYGVIEGLDVDNARVMVKLTVSGTSITCSQYGMKLVNPAEYSKYSKYINKGTADSYKQQNGDQRKSDQEETSDRSHSHRKHKSSRHYDDMGERSGSEKRLKSSRHRDDEYDSESSRYEKRHKHSKHSHESSHSKKRKKDKEGKDSRSPEPFNAWLYPQIRVRIIDNTFKKGKYYNTKVEVIDVISFDSCICKTEDGKLLEDISHSMVETVIPKADYGCIKIVHGPHKGKLAEIIQRDKKKSEAMIQLLNDKDTVLHLDYDKICEYMGDTHEDMDY